MFAHVGFDEFVARVIHGEVYAVVFPDPGDQVTGFGRQAAGVEREVLDGELFRADQVGKHHVFGAQAVAQRGRRILGSDFFQQCDSLLRLARDRVEQCGVVEIEGPDRRHLAIPHAVRRRNNGCGWSTAAW
ncbi:hypothetical protein SDC9_210017 [bioreactor metagenome]|uniref:Uncharacterized protein n=1 Tax=bioreactor metagenome TaxID=1076179 RepID=A0A645JGM6_9ZZZZ